MRLTVLVEDGREELFLTTPLVLEEPSEILLKSATIYWNYNNINNDVNVSVGGNHVTFERGYWTFNSIKSKLEKDGVVVTTQRETGHSKVKIDKLTNLKAIGNLLGFTGSTELKVGTNSSPDMVDINQGFRHVNVSCNVVDKSKNIDQNGKYSDVIATIPIPTDKSLKGTLSHHNNINSKVSINRGTYNFLEFKVSSNVVDDTRTIGNVLLELYITSK